jgi:uncharacterized protein (UPF0276 family)
MALHGVSLSIGSIDPLDRRYLDELKALAKRVQPMWVSDHLCFTGLRGQNMHDLLPLPYTEEALDVVCANVAMAQDVLQRAMLIENPSSYIAFDASVMTEWEFIDALCSRTGCHLLLDVNNIFVSASNHGFDALAYVAGIPADRVRQVHLAGHSRGSQMLIDTHDQPVPPSVWMLYEAVMARLGPVATMIERDDAIPPLGDLLAELDIARAIGGEMSRRAA